MVGHHHINDASVRPWGVPKEFEKLMKPIRQLIDQIGYITVGYAGRLVSFALLCQGKCTVQFAHSHS